MRSRPLYLIFIGAFTLRSAATASSIFSGVKLSGFAAFPCSSSLDFFVLVDQISWSYHTSQAQSLETLRWRPNLELAMYQLDFAECPAGHLTPITETDLPVARFEDGRASSGTLGFVLWLITKAHTHLKFIKNVKCATLRAIPNVGRQMNGKLLILNMLP
jgi:hypothetical protein